MIWIANEGNFVVEIDKDQGLYHSFFGKIDFFGKNHTKTATVLGF